ncbi:MAG: DUF1345 domain-containing protein [Rhodospirillales bacterium]
MLLSKMQAWAIGRFILNGVRVWLLASLAVGIAVWLLLPGSMTLASQVTLSWNVTALTTLAFVMMVGRHEDLQILKARARRYDPSIFGHFLFIVCGAGASIVTTVWTLKVGAQQGDSAQLFHLALATGTIFITWLAIHSIFALHYAHLYYGEGHAAGGPRGGLAFPRDEDDRTPLVYSDFFYFAICAGMTFEASDVQVTQRRMRKWVTCHTVLAFLYNTVILALLVDIAATLI